jgi:hypothetical protein
MNMPMKIPYEILNRPAKRIMKMVERRQEQHELGEKMKDSDDVIPLHTKTSLAAGYERTTRRKSGPRRKRSRGASYQFISRIVKALAEEGYISQLPKRKNDEGRNVVYLMLGSKVLKKWIPEWREPRVLRIPPTKKRRK